MIIRTLLLLISQLKKKFLSEIYGYFAPTQAKGMREHARLAAIWGLNAALASSKDFFALCTAYSNMIIIAHNYQYRYDRLLIRAIFFFISPVLPHWIVFVDFRSIIPFLENDGISMCSQRRNALELQELNAIAELYSSIFFSRWLRGQTSRASSLGFIAASIARTVRSVNLRLVILPRLIHLLMVEFRHDEVVMLLRELGTIHDKNKIEITALNGTETILFPWIPDFFPVSQFVGDNRYKQNANPFNPADNTFHNSSDFQNFLTY